MLARSLSEAFSDLLDTENKLKIFTKEGNVSIISSELLRFTSPFVNSILNDVPCCTSSIISIPEVSKASIDHVLCIVRTGTTNLCSLTFNQIQDVKETASLLQIDLTDLTTVIVPKKEEPVDETSTTINIKQEDINDDNVSIKTEDPEYAEFNENYETSGLTIDQPKYQSDDHQHRSIYSSDLKKDQSPSQYQYNYQASHPSQRIEHQHCSKYPSTSKPANREITQKSLRERLIHLLAVRPYKKQEIFLKVCKDGCKEKDKKKIILQLREVADCKNKVFELKSTLWNDVSEDWPFYSEQDKSKLRRRKAQNMQKSETCF